MHIALVIHDYLPEHLGGSELHTHQLAQEWQRRGHQVEVWCTERDLRLPEGHLRRRVFQGIEVFELIHQREYAELCESYAPKAQPEVFRRLVEERRPDLVHFHHFAHWGAECAVIARQAGLGVVVTLHDFFALCQGATLLRRDRELCTDWLSQRCTDCMEGLPTPLIPEESANPDHKLLYKMRMTAAVRARRREYARGLDSAHRVIAPSHFLREQYLAAGLGHPEAFPVLKTGYPGPVHAPRPVSRSGPLRVGYAGGIYPSKGVHVLVEACARIEPGLVALEVHGALDWFKNYVDELRQLAGDAAVTFAGAYDPADVDRVLQRFDLLVVPSIWYENMPLTIQEAFRNAVPVLVSDHGGMGEAVIEGQGGGHFKAGSVRSLAETLTELSKDRDRLQAWVARRPSVPGLGLIADQLEVLYGQALEAAGRRSLSVAE